MRPTTLHPAVRERVDGFFAAGLEPHDEFVRERVVRGISLLASSQLESLGRLMNRVAIDEQPGGTLVWGSKAKFNSPNRTPQCLGRFECLEPARDGVLRVRFNIDLPAVAEEMASSTLQRPRFDLGVNLVLVGSPVQHIGCAALSTTPARPPRPARRPRLNRGNVFSVFSSASNLLKLRHLAKKTLQSPNRPAPRLRTFRQQLDDARFTQFASDSPCDDPTRFATRSPPMAAIGRFQKGDDIFYAKVVDGELFRLQGDVFGSPSYEKKACCPEGVKTLTPVPPSKIIAVGWCLQPKKRSFGRVCRPPRMVA